MHKQKTVFVGMSGGVDSSVAAYLLKKQGYCVVGVFIKVWQPDFLHCKWEEERLDAMRAAAVLGIPFLTCDAEEAYRRDVAEYFIREYEKGNTPNPDVMCNTHVKFGAFHAFAKANGATHIATGHYARLEEVDGNMRLLRGVDSKKDQSYFLWNVPEEALRDTLFPLGKLTKEEVRIIAKKAGLPNAEKRDSQGICFLGDVDIKGFLSHFLKLETGNVEDEVGNKVGTHEGALLYTLGQRHGFNITTGGGQTTSHFVVRRDLKKNTITVGPDKPHMEAKRGVIKLGEVRKGTLIASGEIYDAQLRYHGPKVKMMIKDVGEHEITLLFEEEALTPSPGQSVVLYEGERVVLGGIVTKDEALIVGDII